MKKKAMFGCNDNKIISISIKEGVNPPTDQSFVSNLTTFPDASKYSWHILFMLLVTCSFGN